MRARGLKPVLDGRPPYIRRSRPMRARGLKPVVSEAEMFAIVAPHAGAWVETCLKRVNAGMCRSRPMRARGLKLAVTGDSLYTEQVAPHAGAWVETEQQTSSEKIVYSRAPCGRVG